MNLGNLLNLGRAYIPGAKTSAVNDVNFKLILNEGALDVATRTKCLKNYGTFDAENVQRYSLAAKLPRYLGIDDAGIWILKGSTYDELDPETIKSLNNKFPNWRGENAALADRYAIFGDWFIPHPYVNTAISNGFLAYYFERPLPMSDNAHFPFYLEGAQSTERSELAILSDSILQYAEWKILKVLNKRDDAYQKFNEYLQNLELVKPLIQTRADVSSHYKTKMEGPRVN